MTRARDNSRFSEGATAGFRNKIINGAMAIAQRGTVQAAFAFPGYATDRWRGGMTSGMPSVVTLERAEDAPAGFHYSLRSTVTTADASIGASDQYHIGQRIEGFDMPSLVADTFTVSFWFRSAKTGVHCVSLLSGSNDAAYVHEFTVAVADTWEYHSFTVEGGVDTGIGTWSTTSGIGMQVVFALAAGTDWQTATTDAWHAVGGFIAGTANQVNTLDTIGNIVALTGVQVEAGGVATPFEQRPFGLELILCQRYFQLLHDTAPAPICVLAGTGSSVAYGNVRFSRMRTTPTVTPPAAGTVQFYGSGISGVIPTTLTVGEVGIDSMRIDVVSASIASGSPYLLDNYSPAGSGWGFKLNAEL